MKYQVFKAWAVMKATLTVWEKAFKCMAISLYSMMQSPQAK